MREFKLLIILLAVTESLCAHFLWPATGDPDLPQICTEELISVPILDKELYEITIEDEDGTGKYDLRYSILREQAYCYLAGMGVTQDNARAIELLKQSSKGGDARSDHVLASLYLFASNDYEFQKEGFEILQKEADGGSAWAVGKLGYAYFEGRGVDRDIQKSLEYYEVAAKKGMTPWQHLLRYIYEQGIYGVEKDRAKSEYWKNYEPKIHIMEYSCAIAEYLRAGIALERNDELYALYDTNCQKDMSANKALQSTASGGD